MILAAASRITALPSRHKGWARPPTFCATQMLPAVAAGWRLWIKTLCNNCFFAYSEGCSLLRSSRGSPFCKR